MANKFFKQTSAEILSDLLSDAPPVLVSDALRRRSRRDASGLEHDEVGMILVEYVGGEKGGRNACGFARAGLCDDHRSA